jgi:pimeloyl-ACP methyl ester carboxylesterase
MSIPPSGLEPHLAASDFRHWNIEEYLPAITCPVLAIQGEDDEYGTMEQLHRIGAACPMWSYVRAQGLPALAASRPTGGRA